MKKILYLILGMLVLTGCTKKIIKVDPQEVTELKQKVIELQTEIEEKELQINSLLQEKSEYLTNDSNEEYEEVGYIMAESTMKGIANGESLYVYMFRSFQSDAVFTVVSSKKIEFKDEIYKFKFQHGGELISYEISEMD